MARDTIWQGVGKKPLELHHAYALVGERKAVLDDVYLFLQEAFKLDMRGNPDIHISAFDSLSIDDSRRLKDIQQKRAFKDRKIIVAAFNTATSDAQNALLKVLEEPTAHTHFFLIVPSLEVLLPTVQSRVFVVEVGERRPRPVHSKAKEFLQASLQVRLEIAKTLADSVSDEKIERQAVIDFVGDIEALLASSDKKSLHYQALEDVALCRNYLGDRASSVKMLLEHLAVALPVLNL